MAMPYDFQLCGSLPERNKSHVAYFATKEEVRDEGIIDSEL